MEDNSIPWIMRNGIEIIDKIHWWNDKQSNIKQNLANSFFITFHQNNQNNPFKNLIPLKFEKVKKISRSIYIYPS